ncbi:ER membrane protein complex subunit 2-B, partial [Trichinella sp. T6]
LLMRLINHKVYVFRFGDSDFTFRKRISGALRMYEQMDKRNKKPVTFEEGLMLLHKWREDNVRQHERLLDIWENVIEPAARNLDDERWAVYEQVYIAAIDCADVEIASSTLTAMHKKFQKSERLVRLQGLCLEADGQYEEAMELYSMLMETNPTNLSNAKRRIACLISLGRTNEAIRELCSHLQNFMNDTESWMELCHLYLKEFEFPKAVFCVEEMILSQPECYAYHLFLAEIKFTIGGVENLELAKVYYCHALKLKQDCPRACWGLYITSLQLILKSSGQKKKEHNSCLRWASTHLLRLYEKSINSSDSKKNSLIRPIQKLLRGTKITDTST